MQSHQYVIDCQNRYLSMHRLVFFMLTCDSWNISRVALHFSWWNLLSFKNLKRQPMLVSAIIEKKLRLMHSWLYTLYTKEKWIALIIFFSGYLSLIAFTFLLFMGSWWTLNKKTIYLAPGDTTYLPTYLGESSDHY